MLAKRNFLISTLLSTVILTNNVIAQGLDCSNGQCHINVGNFTPSKNMPKKIEQFKKIKREHRFIEDSDLKVAIPNIEIETIELNSEKYVRQMGEFIEPIREEIDTIVLAPNKYVDIMSPEDLNRYNRQQLEAGGDIELIKPSLPMSLYYCQNNTEPVYNEELHQFQCTI